MTPLMNASTKDLRDVLLVLCRDEGPNVIVRAIRFLRPFSEPDLGQRSFDSAAFLIQQAGPREMHLLIANLSEDEEIKKRIHNYLEALGHCERAEVDRKAADADDTIKHANPHELRNIMLALCEDDDAKNRLATHLRVLRWSQPRTIGNAYADQDMLIESATMMELRAIGLGDEDIKKRLLESLRVLRIFGELQRVQDPASSECKMS